MNIRRSKLRTAKDAIAKFVNRNCILAVGGMHMHNNPMGLVRELVRQDIKIKTLVTSPSANINADLLIGAGLVAEILVSYIGFEHLGLAPHFRAYAEKKMIKVRECDEAYIVYGLRAGASSLPFIPLPKGLDATDIPNLNPNDYKLTKDPFTGKDILCIRAIQPEIALIHCQKSDEYGNAIFEGSMFTDFDMVKASAKVIIMVEEVVPHQYILDNARMVSIPAHLVDAVVPITFGCHPTASHNYYTYDEEHLLEYLKLCKENFSAYLEKYVYNKTNDDYLELIGEQKLQHLRAEGKVW